MINKDDAVGVFSQAFNWLAALMNTVFVFFIGLDLPQWGIMAGIIFGAVSTFVTVWSKRRLVKIAEKNGQVSL